ncbi:MAG: hypothetical protein PHT94_02340 [Candidatus Nanoarchaeia archaeon]|nr:hypothetical protein [Candidatus Nanoarchaeia archaeon]
MDKFNELLGENKQLIELFEEFKHDKLLDKTDLEIEIRKLDYIKKKILMNNYKMNNILNIVKKGVENDKD